MTSRRGAQIFSTIPAFVSMLRNTEPHEITAATWADGYESHHPAIFASYYSSWGDPARRSAAAEVAHAWGHQLPERERRAAALVESLSDELVRAGLAEEPLHAVHMVGVGSSNGWVAVHESVPTLFLALELLPDPPHDRVLVAHEALHTRHGVGWPDTVAADLWREGTVTALSRRLCPGLLDSSYLWFDDEHSDWVRACEGQGGQVAGLVWDHLTSDDESVIRGLFSLRGGAEVPVRAGYWLGDRLATDLLDRGASPHELLSASYDTSVGVMRRWLAER